MTVMCWKEMPLRYLHSDYLTKTNYGLAISLARTSCLYIIQDTNVGVVIFSDYIFLANKARVIMQIKVNFMDTR